MPMISKKLSIQVLYLTPQLRVTPLDICQDVCYEIMLTGILGLASGKQVDKFSNFDPVVECKGKTDRCSISRL